MTAPTWLIMGDEFTQGMFRYLRDPLAGRAVGDVIGSKDSDYKQWATCGDEPCGVLRGRVEPKPTRSPIEQSVDEVKPELVLLMLGTNPGASVDLPADFMAHVQTAVTKAGKHGAQVMLVGPFANDPAGKRLAALRRFVPDTISGYALAEGLPRDRDGLHFTQDGYKVMAERVVAAVFGTLTKRQAPRQPVQPGAGGQLQPTFVPSTPQQVMTAGRPLAAAPVPVWVWGLVGVAGLSVAILTVVLVKRRRARAVDEPRPHMV